MQGSEFSGTYYVNHYTDQAKVQSTLMTLSSIFKNDDLGFKKQAVINYIAAVNWSELASLEDATSKGDVASRPVMG